VVKERDREDEPAQKLLLLSAVGGDVEEKMRHARWYSIWVVEAVGDSHKGPLNNQGTNPSYFIKNGNAN
jgi:hypothetical protein